MAEQDFTVITTLCELLLNVYNKCILIQNVEAHANSHHHTLTNKQCLRVSRSKRVTGQQNIKTLKVSVY
jgi:hypothetical protein